ncbi:hypothetical protein BGW80DRAFT_1170469 [Lactifluus volemus]|nr:hypothetical protein BGW80DRAFT_1170469 [Lactifluus volemus]
MRANSQARKIVLGIIRSHNEPITTHDLYHKAVEVNERVTPWAEHLRKINPAPPHPEHSIRSMRYLKHTLKDLVRTQHVKKVHIKRTLTPAELEQRKATMSKSQLKKTALSLPVSTWLWQLDDELAMQREKEASEAEFGEDWGHLNKRRRRARVEKVARDVKWAQRVERARKEMS